MADCLNCTEKCPQAELAHDIAKGRLYATNELVELVKKIESGKLVEVVRCKDCVHAVEIEKDYVRKHFVDGTKQCELGRADTVFGYSIISNDGFCDSGERRKDGN